MLLKLLFLLLSLCLYGEDVARGGYVLVVCYNQKWRCLTRLKKLFVSSMVEFEKSKLAKLGMPLWQQIHET